MAWRSSATEPLAREASSDESRRGRPGAGRRAVAVADFLAARPRYAGRVPAAATFENMLPI
jgi:hypothetical protein